MASNTGPKKVRQRMCQKFSVIITNIFSLQDKTWIKMPKWTISFNIIRSVCNDYWEFLTNFLTYFLYYLTLYKTPAFIFSHITSYDKKGTYFFVVLKELAWCFIFNDIFMFFILNNICHWVWTIFCKQCGCYPIKCIANDFI